MCNPIYIQKNLSAIENIKILAQKDANFYTETYEQICISIRNGKFQTKINLALATTIATVALAILVGVTISSAIGTGIGICAIIPFICLIHNKGKMNFFQSARKAELEVVCSIYDNIKKYYVDKRKEREAEIKAMLLQSSDRTQREIEKEIAAKYKEDIGLAETLMNSKNPISSQLEPIQVPEDPKSIYNAWSVATLAMTYYIQRSVYETTYVKVDDTSGQRVVSLHPIVDLLR